MIVAYFIVIPTAIILKNSRAITVFIGRPEILPKAQKWANALWITATGIALIGFITGTLIIGDAKHFSSPHAIMGLFALLPTLGIALMELPTKAKLMAIIPRFSIVRAAILALLIGLSQLLFITGFSELSKISLCVTDAVIPSSAFLVLGSAVLGQLISAMTVIGLKFYVQKWMGGKREEMVWAAEEKVVSVRDEFVAKE
jgi:hypothetical protein